MTDPEVHQPRELQVLAVPEDAPHALDAIARHYVAIDRPTAFVVDGDVLKARTSVISPNASAASIWRLPAVYLSPVANRPRWDNDAWGTRR